MLVLIEVEKEVEDPQRVPLHNLLPHLVQKTVYIYYSSGLLFGGSLTLPDQHVVKPFECMDTPIVMNRLHMGA